VKTIFAVSLGPAHGKDSKVCRVPGVAHGKYLTVADAHQRRQPFAVRLLGAHAKEYICCAFLFLPRASLRLMAKSYSLSCAPCLAHGEDLLYREFLVCREPGLWLSAKSYLCRVSDGMHTAKSPAHGIARDSGSVVEHGLCYH